MLCHLLAPACIGYDLPLVEEPPLVHQVLVLLVARAAHPPGVRLVRGKLEARGEEALEEGVGAPGSERRPLEAVGILGGGVRPRHRQHGACQRDITMRKFRFAVLGD